MSNVAIVTDSTSCLAPQLIKEYGIHIVSVGLVIDGISYRDSDLSNDEFWTLFYQAKKLPTTSAVSPGDFTSVFTDIAKSTDAIVCIVLSKALSATHEAAVQASEIVKSEHPHLNIEIIDSKTATGALGFIVLEAARAAQRGKNIGEVAQVARDMIPRVKFMAGMDTLKYLIKTGRAPKTGYVGELLQVKPIVGMVSGTGLVELIGKVRGKRNCMLKLAELVNKYIDTTKPVHLMVHYTDGISPGEELRDIVTSRTKCEEVYLTPYTPVMASASGPVVALSFYS